MGAIVVDASVVIAFLDPRDAHHGVAVHAIREARASGPIVLPATAFAEILVGANRLGSAAVKATEDKIDRAIDVIRDVDREVARTAAALRAGHRTLRLPDALVIAVGAVIDAEATLTADRKWLALDQRVRLIGGEWIRDPRRRYRVRQDAHRKLRRPAPRVS